MFTFYTHDYNNYRMERQKEMFKQTFKLKKRGPSQH